MAVLSRIADLSRIYLDPKPDLVPTFKKIPVPNPSFEKKPDPDPT